MKPWLLGVLILFPASHASLVEDTSCKVGPACVRYQNDGHAGRDASDICVMPAPQAPPQLDLDAQLVSIDDPQDNWAYYVDPARVGQPHFVVFAAATFDEAATVERALELRVYAPGCFQFIAGAISTRGTTVVVFFPDQPGVHTLQFRFADGVPVSGSQAPEPQPVNSHCSPACVWSYRFTAI